MTRRRRATTTGRWADGGESRDMDDSPAPDTEETPGAGEEFRRRLALRDYRALFGEDLTEVMAQASAAPALQDELGAVRIVLARLLIEERDPARLAAGVARLTSIAVQAARVQRTGDGAIPAELIATMERLRVEIEGE